MFIKRTKIGKRREGKKRLKFGPEKENETKCNKQEGWENHQDKGNKGPSSVRDTYSVLMLLYCSDRQSSQWPQRKCHYEKFCQNTGCPEVGQNVSGKKTMAGIPSDKDFYIPDNGVQK